ncbi:MAG: hypothetical protein DRR19_13935, partial [Candidatus Parabeggiatoa sp. nov. 1]
MINNIKEKIDELEFKKNERKKIVIQAIKNKNNNTIQIPDKSIELIVQIEPEAQQIIQSRENNAGRLILATC